MKKLIKKGCDICFLPLVTYGRSRQRHGHQQRSHGGFLPKVANGRPITTNQRTKTSNLPFIYFLQEASPDLQRQQLMSLKSPGHTNMRAVSICSSDSWRKGKQNKKRGTTSPDLLHDTEGRHWMKMACY
ncbi:Hypothetical predicted protein [Scomber scombrus]|uniref:Uncharacterized protein n=1 Tax=Scomber scombrus TaxID=13677 RepID=A0AAV1QES4_SCOSC